MKYIHLYNDSSAKTLDLNIIIHYLRIGLKNYQISLRKDFISHHITDQNLPNIAEKIAGTRIKNISSKKLDQEPLYGEIEYEKRSINNPDRKFVGVLYDGYEIQKIFRNLIKEDESNLSHIHIAFTNKILCTWEKNDGRYHARAIIIGFPSLISTSGVVEAPAKPKEFYLLHRQYELLGFQSIPIETIKSEIKKKVDFLEPDDPRLTEVLKGYVMQALFFHIFGEVFCEDVNCKLFNAHWQKDLLKAQLGEREFCEIHEKMLKELK